MTAPRIRRLAVAFAALGALAQTGAPRRAVPSSGYREWSVYGGGDEAMRYTALDQINRDNVRRLEVAWTYDTGDAFTLSLIHI